MNTADLLPGLSAVIPVRDGDRMDYCWREAGASLLAVSDELIFVDGGSTDGTREAIVEWGRKDPRVRVVDFPWPNVPSPDQVAAKLPGPPAQPRMLVDWLECGRAHCRYSMAINTDADEVLCDNSHAAIRQAVAVMGCRYFYRLHFWRDAQHITQDDKVVGSYVARLGPTIFQMTSDEPRPDGEPLIRQFATKDPTLRFFHMGFIRRPEAFFAKSKVVQAWIANSYDDRLLDAEKRGVSWFDTTEVGALVPYTAGDHPAVLHQWLADRGYSWRAAP